MTKEDYLKQIEIVNRDGQFKPSWESLSQHQTPKWFENAKFGIFIHYGLYSVPAFGNEWYSRNMYNKRDPEYRYHIETFGPQKDFGYKDFIPLFTAERFDAKHWIETFKNAGAKYVVPVMEHHDGFSMYDSELNRWNAFAMGPKKNICGELKDECERQGLVFCGSSHRAEHYYFMNLGREIDSDVNDEKYRDFYGPAVLRPEYINVGFDGLTENPECVGPDKEWIEDWLARTAEIIDRYKPAMLYFDTAIQNKEYKPYLKKLCAYYYNRAIEWKKEVTICYKHYAFPPDVATFDMERGGLQDISPRYWQTDTAIGNKSWGYVKENTFKRSYKLICDLIDTVSKNGNFLLNIGPKADGSFTKEEEKVLKEIGEWLSVNGEGIYGTRCWSQYKEGDSSITDGSFNDSEEIEYNESDYRFTYKNGYIYAFWMRPINGDAKIKAFKAQPMRGMIIDKVELLSTGADLQFERTEKAMVIKRTNDFMTDKPLCFRIKLL
ncbi:alpha-L-fucosidase [Pseudobutyrivibrio sp. ACV-2]|uniref:alpha-L-fucosidase n=1 Tax=Pseudobutyrivibrio sp. ACV-2 TaxID=1520801 RepID=UPI00089843D5|nr:alpha-L-fucosidase [Pseudobutyrivibrio sp. ACV-2]SEA92966.1 alpha-L-fucosidase [Pseudobutyrivibrio sp. ACV-2]